MSKRYVSSGLRSGAATASPGRGFAVPAPAGAARRDLAEFDALLARLDTEIKRQSADMDALRSRLQVSRLAG